MRLSRLVAVLAVGGLLTACSSSATRESSAPAPAPAPQAAAAAAPAPAPAEGTAKADRMVCKSIAPTGSRIARKTCRTQSQWEQMAREGRDAAGQVQRRGDQTVPAGN